MKTLLRLLGKLHLFLDTNPPRQEGGPVDPRTREQMRKDVEWQREVKEATRPLRENSSH